MIYLDPDHLYHEGLPMPGQPAAISAHPVLGHAMAFWRSATVLSAYELGVFAELALGSRTADELTAALGLQEDAAQALIEALVSLGLVQSVGEAYQISPDARPYLDPRSPTYLGAWLNIAGGAMRSVADITAEMRSTAVQRPIPRSLADRMWADIAGILAGIYPPDQR